MINGTVFAARMGVAVLAVMAGAEALHHAELLAFRCEIQAVPRFDFDGGAAVREERVEPGAGQRFELRFGASAHVPHRLEDAPPLGGDGLIVFAQRAPLVVVQPRRPEDGVGVAVDEAREQHALDVEALRVGRCALREVAIWADRRDALTLDEDGRVFEHLELGKLLTPARPGGAAAGDHLTRPDEQRAQSAASRIGRRTPWRCAALSASGYPASA